MFSIADSCINRTISLWEIEKVGNVLELSSVRKRFTLTSWEIRAKDEVKYELQLELMFEFNQLCDVVSYWST